MFSVPLIESIYAVFARNSVRNLSTPSLRDGKVSTIQLRRKNPRHLKEWTKCDKHNEEIPLMERD